MKQMKAKIIFNLPDKQKKFIDKKSLKLALSEIDKYMRLELKQVCLTNEANYKLQEIRNELHSILSNYNETYEAQEN